jgi:hypothetical protein
MDPVDQSKVGPMKRKFTSMNHGSSPPAPNTKYATRGFARPHELHETGLTPLEMHNFLVRKTYPLYLHKAQRMGVKFCRLRSTKQRAEELGSAPPRFF